ncbi:uncharacterized protein NPIL_36051 [Nephila pilipes]|uniref:Uncharacterized protein n=1 Tax=Nephila pilipes TaxID=299642 RepID=A0A8X6Q829_NEPPI|nr:uncharacterized protein NPIL_36051 [Nephila pilipes]
MFQGKKFWYGAPSFPSYSLNQWLIAQVRENLGVHCEHLWFPLSNNKLLATVQSLSHHGGHQSGEPGCYTLTLYDAKHIAWQDRMNAPGIPTKESTAGPTPRTVYPGKQPRKSCWRWLALFNLENNMTRTLEDLSKFGLRQSDLLEVCGVNTESGVSPCKNFVSIIASDEKGYPNNCVAIESLWGQPNAKEKQIEVTGKILMALKMKPEEYISYTDLVQAHILMHDSHSIGNPMKEGITLEAGMSHNLFVNKRITTRLPYPYKTNCTDYLKLWKENGGHGPLTEKACEDKCKMEQMMETFGCVGQSITYPNNNSICMNGSIFPSLAILDKCSVQCSEACEEIIYNLRTEVKFDQAERHCTVESDFFLRYRALRVGTRLHNDPPETGIGEPVTEVEDGRILRRFMYLGDGAANCRDVQLHWWIHGHVVRNFSGIPLRFSRNPRLFDHLSLPEQKEAQETFNTQKLSHVKKSMY